MCVLSFKGYHFIQIIRDAIILPEPVLPESHYQLHLVDPGHRGTWDKLASQIYS